MTSERIPPEMFKKINYMRRMYEDVPFVGGGPEKRLTDDEWYYIIRSNDGSETVFEPDKEDD